ncbi:MAG: GAF domain-containing protein [Bacteroidetes bacterium]|nr:MAG: GAF domain-containing protein [Bacteroidota bacterium]
MEELVIPSSATKEEKYKTLLPQIDALIEPEGDLTANLANITAALHQSFGFWWTGFYLVKGNQLVLGPFQGPVACTRIALGKGVCGTAWQQAQTILVPNVDEFPGHIACSSASKSEIVVPVFANGEVVAVLDVDSEHLTFFDDTDKIYLEQIAQLAGKKFI